mmetsp:Transcript_6854/g.16407  ORF Transcript_6854/g.16407 Transcript_6854/m.16407 type:complete len:223 (-) Transcript_6854:1038-1706(-)
MMNGSASESDVFRHLDRLHHRQRRTQGQHCTAKADQVDRWALAGPDAGRAAEGLSGGRRAHGRRRGEPGGLARHQDPVLLGARLRWDRSSGRRPDLERHLEQRHWPRPDGPGSLGASLRVPSTGGRQGPPPRAISLYAPVPNALDREPAGHHGGTRGGHQGWAAERAGSMRDGHLPPVLYHHAAQPYLPPNPIPTSRSLVTPPNLIVGASSTLCLSWYRRQS